MSHSLSQGLAMYSCEDDLSADNDNFNPLDGVSSSPWPSDSPVTDISSSPGDTLPAQTKAPRKKNNIPKGFGPDSRPDPRDGYLFANGHFAKLLRKHFEKLPAMPKLVLLCKAIKARYGNALTAFSRISKRRLPNTFSWLDENQAVINDQFLLAEAAKLR
jgi:hypothetical protein